MDQHSQERGGTNIEWWDIEQQVSETELRRVTKMEVGRTKTKLGVFHDSLKNTDKFTKLNLTS